MGEYADQLDDLLLFETLKARKKRDGLSQSDVTKLVGTVTTLADTVGPLLKRIPLTFRQYTEHDIRHCCNVIDIIGKLVPQQTLAKLNALELSVMLMSALLHDCGMYVTDAEKLATVASEDFAEFAATHQDRVTAIDKAATAGNDYLAGLVRDSMLAEYYRRVHPERVRLFIEQQLSGCPLNFGEYDLVDKVVTICESHGWGMFESRDPTDARKAVNHLDPTTRVGSVALNVQYAACCLRLADIMDFDRSRTPLSVYEGLGFVDDKSWQEWNKHLAVKQWHVDETDVEYGVECQHPAVFVAVMAFLDDIDEELRNCRHLLTKVAPKKVADRYAFHLIPVVDRRKVKMEDDSYIAGAFRFQLDYERIMRLLMDRSLYPDPSLFLRELLQNALDACRYEKAHRQSTGRRLPYTPRIGIQDLSDDPQNARVVFQDNGSGMSRAIVEQYLLRVGRSYYRSPEFEHERARMAKKGVELEACSQFGIGILSCFMVADRLEIETHRFEHEPLKITVEGPTKYFTIQRLPKPDMARLLDKPTSIIDDGPPSKTGTRVTVFLRPGVQLDVLQVLKTFAVNVEFPIRVWRNNRKTPDVVAKRGWEALEAPLVIGHYTYVGLDDGWKVREPSGERNRAAAPVGSVLVASYTALRDYDFSRHLHGTAWLWLLRGPDAASPSPRRGDLAIVGRQLVCTGVPSFIGQVQDADWDGMRGELLAALRWSLEGRFTQKQEELAFRLEELAGTKRDSPNWERLQDSWSSLTRTQRLLALKYAQGMTEFERMPYWYETPEVMRSLLRGDGEWSEFASDFRFHAELPTWPQTHALHGILLPGGLMNWDPMVGSSGRISLLPLPGGLRLDARGAPAPSPTASRLFVDRPSAQAVAVPFARALLRHARTLAGAHPEAPEWRDWLDDLPRAASDLLFWPQAVCAEMPAIEDSLGYALRGGQARVGRQQLVEEYGRWVPTGLFEGGFGGDHWTRIMLRMRPRRRTDDGIAVDMEAVPETPAETLADLIGL